MYLDRIAINNGESNPVLGVDFDRYYEGQDLTVKWAAEIAASPYNGDAWAWIRARIRAGNFLGIHTKDYIPIKTSNNVNLKAEVAGINTYTNYGDTAVGKHIDFICRELWPTLHVINRSTITTAFPRSRLKGLKNRLPRRNIRGLPVTCITSLIAFPGTSRMRRSLILLWWLWITPQTAFTIISLKR